MRATSTPSPRRERVGVRERCVINQNRRRRSVILNLIGDPGINKISIDKKMTIITIVIFYIEVFLFIVG